MKTLFDIAKESLSANQVQSQEGPIFVAGGHQFRTFWVRDICYAVPALLQLDFTDAVKNLLEICFKYQRADGLIARGFDVTNPKTRVVAATVKIHDLAAFNYAKHPLKPEYLGEHGTPAVDSNLLSLLAVTQWTQKTGSRNFFDRHGSAIYRSLDFIEKSKVDGLLMQPAFSDWQDSARREGATFYLNVLYLRVLRHLQKCGFDLAGRANLEALQDLLWERFFDAKVGLFRSQVGREQYSLETQLWCVEEDLFARQISRATLWQNLLNSPLWGEFPGRPVWPHYPTNDISWTTKIVGLRHYHDDFYWSWLLGESLKVAKMMDSKNQVTKLEGALSRVCQAQNTVHEIYRFNGSELIPFRGPLYRSEYPFSWGAGKIIEGLGGVSV